MKYLKIIDENRMVYPYHLKNLNLDFPNTSFSPNTDLSDWNIFPVKQTQRPNDLTKHYVEEVVYDEINQVWFNNWIGSDKTPEEITQLTENKWSEVRFVRNQYLSECDWTQLSDSPLSTEQKAEWVTYRQELRDVTLQTDPFNIIWPTKPI